jgi:RNA polymerase sigma-70 factor (ECF subfamily)
VHAFGNACEAEDAAALALLLAPDVVVVVDGGGKASITADPARGIRDGMELLLRLLAAHPGATVSEHSVNGGSGLVLRHDNVVVGVASVSARGGLARDVWVVVNPDKLESWNSN